MLKFYNLARIYKIFGVLLTLFLLIKRKDKFLFFKPLTPKKLRENMQNLGASFIKLAQVLATRSDFFPPSYINELKNLHDSLPAMSKDELKKVLKTNFFKFEEEPIASASIGQVHVAYLDENTKVAVKLRKFDIEKKIKADIKIISFFNVLFRPLFSHYTKHSIEALITEFSDMILKEVNFNIELSNLKKFKKLYGNSNIIFPKTYDEYCTIDTIVMSFEEGFRFDDIENIKKYDIDIRSVINDLVKFYVDQMLITGFFHADPHPGNVFINKDSRIILLDFGMVKSVDSDSRIAIIELLQAANKQDFMAYVRAAKKLGIITYETPNSMMADFVEQFFAIFSNNSLSSKNMQDLAYELMENTRKFPFKLPQEAIYILRASAIIEGLGTTYIENFNGIKDVLPILLKNIPKALGYKETITENIIDEISDLPILINAIKNTFKRADKGELEVQISKAQLEFLQKSMSEYFRSFLFGGILIVLAFFILIGFESKIIATIIFLIGAFKILFKR